MPKTHPRLNHRVDPTDCWSAADVIEMDAVVAACALVAQADGWVTQEERKRTVQRMIRSPAIALFGAHEVTAAFDALVDRFEHSAAEAELFAETAVQAVKADTRSARWLVETACAVAESDGGYDAEERSALLRLCELLDLDPRSFSLVVRDEARG